MSVEDNKALIRRLYELWNQRQLVAYYQLYAQDFVLHGTARDMSLGQMKQFEAQMDAAFPDAKCIIDNMVAEGDKIAFQANVRMTHTGPFMGIAATGKKFEIINTHIVRVAANMVAEWWGTTEFARVMQELGVVPSAQPKK